MEIMEGYNKYAELSDDCYGMTRICWLLEIMLRDIL